jgi:hypothetical protein
MILKSNHVLVFLAQVKELREYRQSLRRRKGTKELIAGDIQKVTDSLKFFKQFIEVFLNSSIKKDALVLGSLTEIIDQYDKIFSLNRDLAQRDIRVTIEVCPNTNLIFEYLSELRTMFAYWSERKCPKIVCLIGMEFIEFFDNEIYPAHERDSIDRDYGT